MRSLALVSSLLLAAFGATAFGQASRTGAKELGRGEIVRISSWGGLTRKGPYWNRVVILSDGIIREEGHEGKTRARLSRRELSELLSLIRRTDWRQVRRTPYKLDYPPSAVDGRDIVLAVRSGRRVETWANFEHEGPARSALFQGLARMLKRHRIRGGDGLGD